MAYYHNKFNAKQNGIFDSKAEIAVGSQLELYQREGLISGLRRNKFQFLVIEAITHTVTIEKQLKTKVKHIKKVVVEERAAYYTPDFLYYDNETHEYIACEVKSAITKKEKDYILRRKLFKWKILHHNERKGRKPWKFIEVEH